MSQRLQKILAQAGICSRRKAEELITAGHVTVDGITIRDLGSKADPRKQKITCFGKPVHPETKKIYLLLNKPKGYVTTLSDPQGRPTVVSLLDTINSRVFPVGRLDQDTEGALLLTNDGALAQRILHPRYEIKRTYQALVAGRPGRAQLQRLRRGIKLDNRLTRPARVRILRRRRDQSLLEVIIHEGRKRQVRRMMAAIGHPVVALKRVAYGRLTLGDLPSGAYRHLTENDLRRLQETTTGPRAE